MADIKPWYLSKTIWGSLITILASVLAALGVEIDDATQQQLAEGLLQLVGAAGALLAIYGRLTAHQTIG